MIVLDALRGVVAKRWDSMYCWCEHQRYVHRHFRGGGDCSMCDCSAFGWERLQDAR